MEKFKDEEHTFINNSLLKKIFEEQGPVGEAGRLTGMDGTNFQEIEHLQLDFLKILRLDQMWMLTSLKSLSLSNNLIKRIENLESLVHLVELDLSFNKILKIENLEKLEHLKVLSLYCNKISTLENMDNLQKLSIFTIGKNEIEDNNNILYLRRFKNLRSLNMSGNPCAKSKEFIPFVAGCLPQLIYYEYKRLAEYEKNCGNELYCKLLKQVQKEEAKVKDIDAQTKTDIAEEALYVGSFIEFLDIRRLFDQMFVNDKEGKAFLVMNNEIQQFCSEYEEQFLATTTCIFNVGQNMYQIRKREVDQFLESVKFAKIENQRSSIEEMENFLTKKSEVFKIIKLFEDDYKKHVIPREVFNDKLETYIKMYNNIIRKIWKTLMGLESILNEQMEKVIQVFKHSITKQILIFIKCTQGYFTKLQTLEKIYNEAVALEANEFQISSVLHENFFVPNELKTIMLNKENLTSALQVSRDLHLSIIDARENKLVSNARTWLANLICGLTRKEIIRSRDKILEISHFLDIQREEFYNASAFSVATTTVD